MKFFRCGLLLLLSALLSVSLGACRQKTDFLDVFRGGFSAELDGTLGGFAFAGELVAEPAGYDEKGVPLAPAATFTFYAPESLSGTVLTRGQDGALSLSLGGLTVPLEDDSALAALFALFPAGGNIKEVRAEDGKSTLVGDGFSITFLSTGEPISVQTPTADVRIVRFSGDA